mgnify:CR=1 FL=1
MPKKIQNFAKSALVQPVIVNVGRYAAPPCGDAWSPSADADACRGPLRLCVGGWTNSAGAANLDVIQEIEYVKQEAKIVYLLECLQKTAPPVLIFAENKNDVDDIHEYLLLKGVEAVAIHGGKGAACVRGAARCRALLAADA